MDERPTLDIPAEVARLIAPISDDAPAGAWARYDGTYDRIREARREDDPSLPQGVWQTALKVADWKGVVSICEEALEKRTKDLQIAVWLAEAWIQLRGFAGAALGVRLVAELCSRFWAALYPLLAEEGDDDEKAAARVAQIGWLDEVCARRLKQIPLATVKKGERTYTFAEWERGIDPGAEETPPPEDQPRPPITLETFLFRADLTAPSIWIELRTHTSGLLAATEALELALAEHMPDGPTLRRSKDVARAILSLANDALVLTGGGAPAGVESVTDAPATDAGRAFFSGTGRAIGSRADAYQMLTAASDYLLRTEPHSPVPYLVKRAVSWGNMPLAQLLQEFIGTPEDLVTIQRLLGMRPRDE